MAVHILWDNEEKTILRQIYTGVWDIDDFIYCIQKTHKLVTGLPHTVHIIMDMTTSEKAPSNILAAVRDLDQYIAPNQGIVVLVGGDHFARTIVSMAKRLAPRATRHGHFANTLIEARHYIASKSIEALTPA